MFDGEQEQEHERMRERPKMENGRISRASQEVTDSLRLF